MEGRLGLLCLNVFREFLHPLSNQCLKLALDEGPQDSQPQREAGFYFRRHSGPLRYRLEFPYSRVSNTLHLAFYINSLWRRQNMFLCPPGFAPHHFDFRVEIYGISVPFCDRDTREQGLPLWPILAVSPGLEDLLAGSFHDLRLLDVQARLLRASPLEPLGLNS